MKRRSQTVRIEEPVVWQRRVYQRTIAGEEYIVWGLGIESIPPNEPYDWHNARDLEHCLADFIAIADNPEKTRAALDFAMKYGPLKAEVVLQEDEQGMHNAVDLDRCESIDVYDWEAEQEAERMGRPYKEVLSEAFRRGAVIWQARGPYTAYCLSERVAVYDEYARRMKAILTIDAALKRGRISGPDVWADLFPVPVPLENMENFPPKSQWELLGYVVTFLLQKAPFPPSVQWDEEGHPMLNLAPRHSSPAFTDMTDWYQGMLSKVNSHYELTGRRAPFDGRWWILSEAFERDDHPGILYRALVMQLVARLQGPNLSCSRCSALFVPEMMTGRTGENVYCGSCRDEANKDLAKERAHKWRQDDKARRTALAHQMEEAARH